MTRLLLAEINCLVGCRESQSRRRLLRKVEISYSCKRWSSNVCEGKECDGRIVLLALAFRTE